MLLLIVTLNLMVTLVAAGRVKPLPEPLTVTVPTACVAASRAALLRVAVVTVFSAMGRGAGSTTGVSSSTTGATSSAGVAGKRVLLSESAKSGITDSSTAAWFCSISASAIKRALGCGLLGAEQVPEIIVPDWPIKAGGLAGVLPFVFHTVVALVPDCR